MIPSLTTFLLVPQCKIFVKLLVFLVLDFQPFYTHVRNNNPKILLFCLKALVKTFYMIPYT